MSRFYDSSRGTNGGRSTSGTSIYTSITPLPSRPSSPPRHRSVINRIPTPHPHPGYEVAEGLRRRKSIANLRHVAALHNAYATQAAHDQAKDTEATHARGRRTETARGQTMQTRGRQTETARTKATHTRPSHTEATRTRVTHPEATHTHDTHATQARNPSRCVSPPQNAREQPRVDSRLFDDHRSISPLGSSCFEQPFVRPVTSPSTSTTSSSRAAVQRADTVRAPIEHRFPVFRTATGGQYGADAAGGALRRRNAVRSGYRYRMLNEYGVEENDSPEFHVGLLDREAKRKAKQAVKHEAAFRSGGPSRWELF